MNQYGRKWSKIVQNGNKKNLNSSQGPITVKYRQKWVIKDQIFLKKSWMFPTFLSFPTFLPPSHVVPDCHSVDLIFN